MSIGNFINVFYLFLIIQSLLTISVLSFPNCIKEKFEKFICFRLGKLNDKQLLILLKIFTFILCISILMIPGHMQGHDNIFHIARISALSEGLKNGQFPVLVYPKYYNEYGYANGIFYPDILLYFPAFLTLLGVPVFKSYEILLFLIIIGAYMSMYFSCYKITNSDYTASIFGLLYTTCSYFLVDLYTRSAIGEAQAFIYFPLVIYGFYSIACGDVKEGKYFTIGIVGLVLSHIISTVICIILVLLMTVAFFKNFLNEKKRFLYLIIFGLFSIATTLFFTLPLLEIMRSDVFKYSVVRPGKTTRNAVNPLFTIIECSYDGLTKKYIPQGIGIVFVYLFFICRPYLFKVKNSFSKKMFYVGCFFLFMSTYLFPWKIAYRVLDIIQFPWRLYMCSTLCLLFAYMLPLSEKTTNKKRKIISGLIICCFCVFTVSITTVNLFKTFYTRATDYTYETMSAEYLPLDVKVEEIAKRGEIISSNNKLESSFKREGTNILINYRFNKKGDNNYLELPLIYYKGYKAIEKGHKLLVEKGNNGLVRIYPIGENGSISVYYGFTQFRIIGIVLSLINTIIFIVFNKKTY